MKLSVKYIRINPYTYNEEEVPVGTEYGFWRIVEHTGSGWFPWQGLYNTKEEAEKVMETVLRVEKEGKEKK